MLAEGLANVVFNLESESKQKIQNIPKLIIVYFQRTAKHGDPALLISFSAHVCSQIGPRDPRTSGLPAGSYLDPNRGLVKLCTHANLSRKLAKHLTKYRLLEFRNKLARGKINIIRRLPTEFNRGENVEFSSLHHAKIVPAVACLDRHFIDYFFLHDSLHSKAESNAVPQIQGAPPWETELWDKIIIKYKLNSSWYEQYLAWASEVLSGNLGFSRLAGQPVLAAILERFPITFELVLLSTPIIVILGIWLGVQAAVHQDTAKDFTTRTLAVAGGSLPAFLLGILLVSAFYVQLRWLPRGGRLSWSVEVLVNSTSFMRYTGSNIIDGILNGRLWVTADALLHLLQPVTVIVVIHIALIIRVMRASMLEVLSKNYVIAAKAKGLSEKVVINKHARRNALIPTITIAGLLMNTMLTNLVVTETVFSIQGLGKFALDATGWIDVPAVAGLALVAALFFVLTNLIVDILYVYIDPRIEYARKRSRTVLSP